MRFISRVRKAMSIRIAWLCAVPPLVTSLIHSPPNSSSYSEGALFSVSDVPTIALS